MSRAFVNEDASQDQDPRYDLPERDSSFYDEAAAWALLEGANIGNTRSAETATGYQWGEPLLLPFVEGFLEQAERDDNLRLAQLAKRYIRAAAKR